MSRWRRCRAQAGFTLVEVLVALTVIGLAAASLVPLLVTTARATQVTKLNTIAKDLNQLRIDQMRNLPYHVDAQNGAYVDLLDYYYHDLSTTPTTLPYSLSGTGSADCAVTGQWVDSGTPPAGAPAVPYYQTTFNPVCGFPAGTQTIPAATGFTQVVYAQFMNSVQPKPGPVPDTTLTNAGYNSQVVGHDSPPSLILGVTVITTWSSYGTSHTYRSQTEIADQGIDSPLISSQARAKALLVTSHAADGSSLEAGAGSVNLTGSLSNVSSASAQVDGGYIHDIGGQAIDGASATAVAPPNPSSQSDTTATAVQFPANSLACNSGAVGATGFSSVNSTTANGLPLSPSAGTGKVQASINANGGGSCSGLFFTNQLTSAAATDPTLQLNASSPMVQVLDQTGSAAEIQGAANIEATGTPGATGAVSASASTSSTTDVAVFPGLPFIGADTGKCGNGSQPCGTGLVNVYLASSSLSCQSGAAATASYSGYLTYWTSAGWQSVTLSWSTSAGGTNPLAAINLTQPVSTGSSLTLGSYISAWSAGTAVTSVSGGSAGNESDLQAAVAISTQDTRAGDSGSQIGIQVGHLSCVATDNR